MHDVIDERQSASLGGGRNLLQSVMVANKVVDEARRKKKRCMIFKVDFEKTRIWFSVLEISHVHDEENGF